MNSKTFAKIFIYFVVSIIALAGGAFGVIFKTLPYDEELVHDENEVYFSLNGNSEVKLATSVTPSENSVSVHFLELGNKYTGDCTYIKVGEDIDILIDCGSKSSSISHVSNYLNQYITDNTIEYVFVTHAHQDHYAGFATTTKIKSIFDLYYCNNIIISNTTQARKDSSQYKNFARELDEANAKFDRTSDTLSKPNIYTSLDCITTAGLDSFQLTDNVSIDILKTKYYSSPAPKDEENENSVCIMFNHGEKHFLFTGDLEAEGEASLVSLNTLPKVDLMKAGHHGSKTSSSITLLDAVMKTDKSTIVCVCCCAGSSEYSSNLENQFPTKQFIDRISQYTLYVYVTTMCINYKNNEFTSLNGNIAVISTADNNLNLYCSNNTTPLKDSEWFKTNRYEMCKDSMHESWK